MNAMKPSPTFGVVHIGSIRTSAAIVSWRTPTDVEIIESVQKETTFGEEVLHAHRLSFASIHALCTILQGFRQLFADYGIETVYPIATTVVREAENSLGILDLLRLRTGFSFHVAGLTEETYYKFFALHQRLKRDKTIGKRPLLLLDVTSGGLAFTGWKSGRILFQRNAASGRLSILEHFTKKERSDVMFPSAMRDYLHAALSPLWPTIARAKIHTLVLTGFESRVLAHRLIPADANKPHAIAPETFRTFLEGLAPLTIKKLMRTFSLSERLASILLPTLLLYDETIRTIQIDSIRVMDTPFLQSYATYAGALLCSPHAMREQDILLLDLARSVAMRYGCNLAHDERVETFAVRIFEALQSIHGLSERHGMLLRMSAILHETGKFINLRNYALHTWQTVLGSDFFGITDAEKEIIASNCYYCAKENPDHRDTHYQLLTREQKIVVDKCCAILRLADALDQGHRDKLTIKNARLAREALLLTYRSEDDIALIRWTFDRASVLFREIFGITPILQRA